MKILFYKLTKFFPRYAILLKNSSMFIRSYETNGKKKKRMIEMIQKKEEISKSIKLTISRNLILHKIRIPHVNFENGISPTRLKRVAMHKFGCYLIYHVGDNQFAV